MFKCGRCENEFEKESNFNFHKEVLCATWSEYFYEDLDTRFRCELCETKFRTESDLNLHKIAVWCNRCQKEYNCEFHDTWSSCTKCDKGLRCKAKYEGHWNRNHKRECEIPLKAFEKVEEASVEKEHNVNVTLLKPLIPTRPTEEIETHSVLSKADIIEDLDSPVDEIENCAEQLDKVAQIGPRVEIEGHGEQCDKQENGSNLEGKNEEQDSEESRKDDTEKEDVFVNLENAYGGKAVQKATTSSFCEKCEVNFKNKKNFRRHLIKVHVCGNCDDIFYTRTESKVHVHTFHEGDDDNEVKRKAKRNVNDENYIWKGRRRKLLQTSSILTTILLKIGDMVDVAFDDINTQHSKH